MENKGLAHGNFETELKKKLLTEWNASHYRNMLCEQNWIGDCDHVQIFAAFLECFLALTSPLVFISTKVLITLLLSQKSLVKFARLTSYFNSLWCIHSYWSRLLDIHVLILMKCVLDIRNDKLLGSSLNLVIIATCLCKLLLRDNINVVILAMLNNFLFMSLQYHISIFIVVDFLPLF